MRASQQVMTHNDQKENEAFWAKLLLTLEIGSRIEHGGESDEAGGLVNVEVDGQTVTTVETVERIMSEREVASKP